MGEDGGIVRRGLGWILGGVGALGAFLLARGGRASSPSTWPLGGAGDDGRPIYVIGDSHAVGITMALRALYPNRLITSVAVGGTSSYVMSPAPDEKLFVIVSAGTNDVGVNPPNEKTIASIKRVLGPYAANTATRGSLFFLMPPANMTDKWAGLRERVRELDGMLEHELVPNERFHYGGPPAGAELGPDGLHYMPSGYRAIAEDAMRVLTRSSGAGAPDEGRPTGLLPDGKLDPEFKLRSSIIAERTGIPLDMLLAIMNFETGGTMSASVRNAAGSSAVGLIQFMPQAAALLGTTSAELAQMSAVHQLDYVEKYFLRYGEKHFAGRDPTDAYLAVFSPGMLGKPDDYRYYEKGSKAYEQNRGLDRDKDGAITPGEVRRTILGSLANVHAKGWV